VYFFLKCSQLSLTGRQSWCTAKVYASGSKSIKISFRGGTSNAYSYYS